LAQADPRRGPGLRGVVGAIEHVGHLDIGILGADDGDHLPPPQAAREQRGPMR